MGDPKFSRKTYDTPSHPWQGERIKAEVVVVNEYGLKNKREVWKAQTTLRNLRKQSGDAQAKIEADALLAKCGRLGFLTTDATLNDILTLKADDVLSRRLQTIVYEKGLSSTIKQARQMITHGHIFVNGHKVTVPGYIVTRKEESSIEYDPSSPFTDEMHPMRISAEQAAANAAVKAKAQAEAEAAVAAAAKADAEEAGITIEDGEQ